MSGSVQRAFKMTAITGALATILVASPRKVQPATRVESQGSGPAKRLLESFDGLGAGFSGPQGAAAGRNPSDNSLAVGPDYIVEIVNSRLAVYTKKGAMFDTTGKLLYGAVATNTLLRGHMGPRLLGAPLYQHEHLTHCP